MQRVMCDTDKVPTMFPGNYVKLRPESVNLFLVPPDQGSLVHNLIARSLDLYFLGSSGKLEGVVGFLSLAGSRGDGADDSNAGAIASQRALQAQPSQSVENLTH